jgi:isochorismate pyruvate lyase
MNREVKKSMKEVRSEIDQIDKELVSLLAKRQKYVENAALIKKDRNLIIDEPRIEEVISNIKKFSSSSGLSDAISEPLWRKLIELSIEHEFKEFESK